MAKQPSSKGGTSRIRFIMLDAELPEGDLTEITAAIQNALKPTTTVIHQRLPSSPTLGALSNGSRDAELNTSIDAVTPEEASSVSSGPRLTREQRVRKPTSMKVIDLDLKSEPSFETFANAHAVKNDTERNLVALAWFKEFRPNEIVTANHIYTCYRVMKWPSGIDDFPGILRSLKSQQLVNSVGRGEYEINHIGIARVEKMGQAA